jgi:hypothetical protein
MKTIFAILLTITFLLSSCKKEATPNLFEIPIINWSLTKDQVLSQETKTLLENTLPINIYVAPPFTSNGDGSLRYDGETFLKEIIYCFYNVNKTLESVVCTYEKTNEKTTDVVLQFLHSKYGAYTIKTKSPDPWHFVGKAYQFYTSFGIVVLDEYSQTLNRVVFTKSQYSGYYSK